MKNKKRSARFWLITSGVAVVMLGGSAYLARRYGAPAVKEWRVSKMNAEAREFLTKGDSANALLLARKSFGISGSNVDAWRIAVAAAKLKKTSEVIYYQLNLCRVQPTKQNYLELIRMSLEFGAYNYAADAIKAAAKDSAADPEYHRMAVELYEKTGRPTAAKYHLLSLASLAPTDRLVQLKVSAIEMSEDPQRTNRELRARVRSLADDPALRPQALAMLLREAIDSKSLVDAAELATRMKTIPDLSVERQLLVIESAMLVSPDLVDGLLDGLKAKVAESPQDTVRVIEFLRQKGSPRSAWTWYQKLPEKTQRSENVMWSAAEALLAAEDWSQLEGFVRNANWGELNYQRLTLQSYALRKLGREAEAKELWKLAVASVGSNLGKAGDLVRRVEGWKWREEYYDVLWKIFSIRPQENQVRQALIGWERSQNRTANLNKIFATVAQIEPGDNVNRNNLAYTSLLLDSNLGQASLIADELVRLEPSNPYFITTRALALFKQGKTQDALKQIQSLTFSERAVPERALVEAMALARIGETGKAADILRGLPVLQFLPQEQKLYGDAREDLIKAARERNSQSQLAALSREAQSGGWLELLEAATQREATVEMKLADAAYASGNYAGLAELLKKANWGNYQYLNSALLTYVARQTSGEIPRDVWQRTLTLAERNLPSLQNLLRLVSHWSWPSERIEILSKIFEQNPKDRLVMEELLRYHRENDRLANMLRVLTTHLNAVAGDSDERTTLAYYSLLADQNVAQSIVTAKQVYELEPDNPKRTLVHAFSLWKQQRYAEAATVLKTLTANNVVENIPKPLIVAAIQAETTTPEISRASLKLFDPKSALPEEIALAEKINQRLVSREKAL